MKYIKNEVPNLPLTQSPISDELAKEWQKNGNKDIRDTPWPGIPVIASYILKDGIAYCKSSY